MDTAGEGEGGMIERATLKHTHYVTSITYITMCKMDGQWEFAV